MTGLQLRITNELDDKNNVRPGITGIRFHCADALGNVLPYSNSCRLTSFSQLGSNIPFLFQKLLPLLTVFGGNLPFVPICMRLMVSKQLLVPPKMVRGFTKFLSVVCHAGLPAVPVTVMVIVSFQPFKTEPLFKLANAPLAGMVNSVHGTSTQSSPLQQLSPLVIPL